MKGQGWLIVLVILIIFLIVWLVFNWITVDFEAIQGFFTGLLNNTQVGGG